MRTTRTACDGCEHLQPRLVLLPDYAGSRMCIRHVMPRQYCSHPSIPEHSSGYLTQTRAVAILCVVQPNLQFTLGNFRSASSGWCTYGKDHECVVVNLPLHFFRAYAYPWTNSCPTRLACRRRNSFFFVRPIWPIEVACTEITQSNLCVLGLYIHAHGF